MLNEKYALERKFSELRMVCASIHLSLIFCNSMLCNLYSLQALDEKQNEVINSASNELARRKGDLEVNLNLLNELKVNIGLIAICFSLFCYQLLSGSAVNLSAVVFPARQISVPALLYYFMAHMSSCSLIYLISRIVGRWNLSQVSEFLYSNGVEL